MSVMFPEGYGEDDQSFEEVTERQLADACRAEAEESDEFKQREARMTSEGFGKITAEGTEIAVSFSAEHKYDEDSEEYTGIRYMLTLTASHTVKALPNELLDELEIAGVDAHEPGPEYMGDVNCSYNIVFALSELGIEYCEEFRDYEVWYSMGEDDMELRTSDDDEADETDEIEETEESDESDVVEGNDEDEDLPPTEINIRRKHRVVLANFSRQNALADSLEHDKELTQDFYTVLGELALDDTPKQLRTTKAQAILNAIIVGRNAKFDIAQFFPPELVAEIRD